MIFITCPNCEIEFEFNDDIYEDTFGIKTCECGEQYTIGYDCSDQFDGILVADFFNYNK
ncbi:MAG: hypothetical protein IPP06_17760 [Saprospiraceae bacterium]|nr:hypothetical protein [Candidatus Vicinibacter affinis]